MRGKPIRDFHPSQREDRVLDVPDILHHRYPEVVALPAAGGEPEVDDREPGEREEHQHRDGVGEEAGGGTFCEDDDDTARANRKGDPTEEKRGENECPSSPSASSQSSSFFSHTPVRRPRPPPPSGPRPRRHNGPVAERSMHIEGVQAGRLTNSSGAGEGRFLQ